MNTVIIAVGIVLLVLTMKYIIFPIVGLLFKLLKIILEYFFKLLALFFQLLLYMIKWALISVPVVIFVSAVYPQSINVRVYLTVILLLTVFDIVILRRVIGSFLESHYSHYSLEENYSTEEDSSLYILNKRSKIAHWFLYPSAWTISEKNRKIVEATDSELEKMGYRKKRGGF